MGITTPKMDQWAIRRREWINGQNDAVNELMGKTTPKIYGVVLSINPFSALYCPLIHFRRRNVHFRLRFTH
jgi:hypothetical protein